MGSTFALIDVDSFFLSLIGPLIKIFFLAFIHMISTKYTALS